MKAAVTAIESRDPTTSGHSERVADLTVGLAQRGQPRTRAATTARSGSRATTCTQIEYAALLHDFGKVGVREHVLVKAKKLYEHERELILQRFQLIKRGYKIEGLEQKVRYLTEASRDQVAERLGAVDRDLGSQARRARRDHHVHPPRERADGARAGRVRADRRDRRDDVHAR